MPSPPPGENPLFAPEQNTFLCGYVGAYFVIHSGLYKGENLQNYKITWVKIFS